MNALATAPARPLAPALPSRLDPRGTESLAVLFDRDGLDGREARGGLSPELADRYAGDLRLPLRADRPVVIANFVETIDGIVAMDTAGRTGGGEVSGFSPTDRFVMGLLRTLADVVLVGASTIRTSHRSAWTPADVFPAEAPAYAALRARLGLALAPTTLVATASGNLDPAHPVFRQRDVPVVIAAPAPGVRRLEGAGFPANIAIEPLGDGAAAIPSLVALAGRLGARVVVSEAGPHLFGALAHAGMLDELFVTVSPQLGGRAPHQPRLAMVEGSALWPDSSSWGRLASVRRAGDHLFLRYQFEERI